MFNNAGHEDSDITSISELISEDYSYFSRLSSEFRKNPYLLKIALKSFKAEKNAINPISYALEEALTKENIYLALEKGGNINIYGLLRENEIFHRINIEKGIIPISYALLPNSIKEDDYLMCLYMKICPDEYKNLNERQRNNEQILKEALDNLIDKVNPISYALEGALTKENIDLALEKGNIRLTKDTPISNSRYFVMEAFKRGLYISQYVLLSDTLKSDPEVLKQALLKCDSSTKVNPISYALEGALTKENIDLALEKGNIRLTKDTPISNSRYFVMEAFKRGLYISQYVLLSDTLKSDPEVLKQALLKCDSSTKVNPISYALEGALTEENIDIALEKGNIEFIINSFLLSNRYFVIEAFKKGLYFSQYNNISDTVKYDPEVRSLIPPELDLIYKYDCAAVGILSDGYEIEEEVRGKKDRNAHHVQAINKIIDDFCKKEGNNSYLSILKNTLGNDSDSNKISNPFKASNICASYGIIIIIIEKQNCMIFCPEILTVEQYQKLESFLSEYSEYFECGLCHDSQIIKKDNRIDNENASNVLSTDEVLEIIINNGWVNVRGRGSR